MNEEPDILTGFRKLVADYEACLQQAERASESADFFLDLATDKPPDVIDFLVRRGRAESEVVSRKLLELSVLKAEINRVSASVLQTDAGAGAE